MSYLNICINGSTDWQTQKEIVSTHENNVEINDPQF